MRVLLAPAANDGCRRYRFDLPGKVLQNQGYSVDIRMDYEFKTLCTTPDESGSVVGVKGSIPWDVVVFQRPLRRKVYELINVLQERGVAVVVELDDSFHDLAMTHPTWKETHPDNDPDKNRDWLMACTMSADWVTVTTPYLAQRYAPHGRVSVLPNYVSARYLDLQRRPSENLRIGWSGSVSTHIGDLRLVGSGVVQTVLDETGAEFCVIGTGVGVQDQLGLREPPLASGWVSLDDYPHALAQLDIGIAPHKLTRFGQSKSRLKPLEMASVGVVPVMSPIPDYLSLHEYGVGLMATEPGEWEEHLMSLAKDAQRRERLAAEGREIVREHFLIEDNAWRWPVAWEQALKIREDAKYALKA